ncbi:copper amine oxidase-like protein [Gottschalkia acidurici 9a]|uniref:Copper amine oxidase-like protein n=1 Tax=Gottschalkia acidurici (strain ATCC 7906 / DSM 604 / BCRC 14475 / CIP 104303 / KCTC 5404 / NCIMB 10678 / 9a) TaxID=1128398 RepID=K0AWT0_GOTA9|nr:copper amine oxidase N-terminal domain-containing protein [Gottschalkia acidurici]AFS78278.1 copper amine oxidase-like protein [Gottschalkia acidurici 9a]
MRKTIKLILIITLIILTSSQMCWAEDLGESLNIYHFNNDNLRFHLNGQEFYGDYFMKDDITYMKLRNLGETLEIDLEWDGATQKVSFFDGNNQVTLWINKTTAYIGNNKITLNSPPCIVNYYTYLPLRFTSELLEINVNYEDLREKEQFIRELIFEQFPDWREKELKGRYKFNKDSYTTFNLGIDNYDPDQNVLTLHAFDIIDSPEGGHTYTYNWLYVDLNNNTITDFMGNVINVN